MYFMMFLIGVCLGIFVTYQIFLYILDKERTKYIERLSYYQYEIDDLKKKIK